jgi:hypothetical protein
MSEDAVVDQQNDKKPTCGIVMPISAMKYGEHIYSDEHWGNIYDLVRDAAEDAGFEARMVSHADDANIIQKTIVQNLYDDDVVVCDVSAKNSNVMFEFGLRCAFDKAVVVIKDKETGFSFDTSPFKHIEYSRDLGYKEIKRLQEKLSKCIRATYEESKKPGQSPFLKSFGEFVPKQLEKTELDQSDFIIQEIRSLRSEMTAIDNTRYARLGELTRNDLIAISNNDVITDIWSAPYLSSLIMEKIANADGQITVGELRRSVKPFTIMERDVYKKHLKAMVKDKVIDPLGNIDDADTVIRFHNRIIDEDL